MWYFTYRVLNIIIKLLCVLAGRSAVDNVYGAILRLVFRVVCMYSCWCFESHETSYYKQHLKYLWWFYIKYIYIYIFFFCGAATQCGSWPPHSWGFLDHTRHTTVGKTPLDKWSARRRDLYLTTHNTDNRQTSMPLVGFEPTISAGERPQTYALNRTATGTGI